MRALFLAMTLFTVASCTAAEAPTAAPSAGETDQALMQQTPLTLTPDQSQKAVCPTLWTCNDINWFSTQAACSSSAACSGGGCFRDQNCNGTCFCP